MTEQHTTIFMVEDETSVLAANRRMLARRGYQVEQASCAAEASAYLQEHTPDLLILDIMLPDGSGYDLCRMFREKSENPILFLTGKDTVSDKIEGLTLGCDYYLTKPYNFEEFLAVVHRLLERTEKQHQREQQLTVLKKGRLTVNVQASSVTVDGEPVQLTSKEWQLLLVFMKNEGQYLSADTLYEKVWNTKAGTDLRTVRKHIMNLRAKIKAGESDDYDIDTAYGKGYIFQ